MMVYSLRYFCFLCVACTPGQTQAELASASYAAQQAACIDRYSTRSEIDECRDRVKSAWTIDAGRGAGK